MIQKELVEGIIAARWKSSDEMRAFIKPFRATSEDLLALLDFLTGKKSVDTPEHGLRVRAFSELAAHVSDKNLFEPYIKSLKGEDRYIRAAMVNLLPVVNHPPLLPRLCEYLKSSDGHLRRTVSQVLQKVGDNNVVKTLGELFAERNFPGRNEAIDIAGVIVSHYSVEFFKMVLSTGRPPEKVRTLKYLGSPAFVKASPKAIAAAVQPVLHDSDEAVLSEAIATFSRVCSEEEFFLFVAPFLYHEDLKFVKAAVEGLRYFNSGRTMAALERKLHTGPNVIRMTVLDTVEYIGTKEVHKPLIKALEHRQPAVRQRASDVLAKLTKAGKVDIADTIIWLLRSGDPAVRRMAVDVAASRPDRSAGLWSDILARLRNDDWWIRQRLLDALVDMAGQELTPHIMKYLYDPSDVIRRFALDVLLSLKPPSAMEALLRTAQQDDNWWVRERAVEVLAAMNDARVVPHLLNMATKNASVRVIVLDAMKTMRAAQAGPHAAALLTSENPDIRAAALQCLDALNDPKYASGLLPLTKDKDLGVRDLARDLAKKWNVDYSAYTGKTDETLSVLDRLLIAVQKSSGDDLILLPDNTPYMKRHGKTMPLAKTALSDAQIQSMLKPVLNRRQLDEMKELRDVDFSYEVRSEGIRFRANIFASRTGMSAVFRIIKGDVWKLEDLGLPPVVRTFGDFKNGLILVGGPTGSGKSTTLASIISYINRTSRRHVISIEDPIEVVHKADMGLVNQREVGVHTPSFTQALRMTLREDPDVILVGEMRDLPTIQFAVSAAETGHLVFGTVHTVSADSSVDRLINAYPPEAQEQVRSMLADSLKAVLCQYLIRHKDKQEMVLATEVMINNHAIANLIRKGKTFQIPSVVVTSKEQQMQLMDSCLMDLYKQGKISAEEAYLKARTKSDFEEIVGVVKGGPAGPAPAQAQREGG